MKYVLIDGNGEQVSGCELCPFCRVYENADDTDESYLHTYICRYPHVTIREDTDVYFQSDHYMEGCPLSVYSSAHYLFVSAKCIYYTIKSIIDNFKEWYYGNKA